MQRQELERLSREELIAHAERLNVPRPRVLTQPELIDEIIARTARTDKERARSRGWLGKARDLLARVVEQGLHLPDAARAIRSTAAAGRTWPTPPPPLPTVTLAEIYAAQGHLERAVAVLDEVIAREPDHKEARELRERFVEQTQRTRARPSRAADAAAGRADAKEAADVKEPAQVDEPAEAEEPAEVDEPAQAEEPAVAKEALAFSADEGAAGADVTSTTGAEEANTSGLVEAEALNATAPAASEEVGTTGVEEATTSGMVEAEKVKETGTDAAEEVSTTGAKGADTPGMVEAEHAEAAGAEKVDEVSPTGAEEANTASVVEAEEASPARAPEPAPEEAAAAADTEGAGPVTERDAGAPATAEASPDEGAAAAESASEAREEAAEREEIEQTVVDGGAIADLVERLRAGEEAKADEEPAAVEEPEEDLPEGYDVDEVVAIAVDPETIYVYWEVRAVTLARALSRRPGGRLALRIAAVTASWDGPVTRTWDLHIDALYGDRFVRDIPQGANVRVSVGWLEDAAFEPFAVGAEVASPRLAPSEVEASEVGRWGDQSPAAPVPLGRAPRGYAADRAAAGHGYGGGQVGGGAENANAAAAAASPVALGGGRPAPALTALAPSGGGGPGIDRATRSAELTRSYFRSVAGSYLRGGASDQARGGASEHGWGGASDRVRGGASELAWGGASDLARARNI